MLTVGITSIAIPQRRSSLPSLCSHMMRLATTFY
jgi:hypothetical protein